jgi:hypothetical protein
VFGQDWEPHLQAGLELNATALGRSQARYAAGITYQPLRYVSVTIDFLGRSEFEAQSEIPSSARLPAVRNGVIVEEQQPFTGRPVLLDVKRNDVLDVALDLKIPIGSARLLYASCIVPLNDDGLRADFIPTIGIEFRF